MLNGSITLSPKQKALVGFSVLTLPVLITFYSKLKRSFSKKMLKEFLSFFIFCNLAYRLYGRFNTISFVAVIGAKVSSIQISLFETSWLFIYKTGTFCFDYCVSPVFQNISQKILSKVPESFVAFLNLIFSKLNSVFYHLFSLCREEIKVKILHLFALILSYPIYINNFILILQIILRVIGTLAYILPAIIGVKIVCFPKVSYKDYITNLSKYFEGFMASQFQRLQKCETFWGKCALLLSWLFSFLFICTTSLWGLTYSIEFLKTSFLR